MFVGLVGKPSAGKSTTFKALTLADVAIANYPFTTIEPNEGAGFVRVDCVDKDLNTQCNPRVGMCVNHIRFVPVKLLDVAGLVPDAHLGKGKGNQFLDDLRQADVLIHVIDVSGSTNERGEEVPRGSHDPAFDVRFLEVELDLWYLGILKKGWEKFARGIQQEHAQIHKALAKQLSGLGVTEDVVQFAVRMFALENTPVINWTEEDLRNLVMELRKKPKPMLIAANKIDVPGAAENLERLKQEFPNYTFVPCSAESEVALKEAAKHGLIAYVPGASDFKILKPDSLSDAQQKALEFIRVNILQKFGSTGIQNVIDAAVFDVLRYIAIFPGGVNKLEDSEGRRLPDCFLLKPGSTALDFAYSLHSDFGDHFIRAINVKTKKAVGKEHALQHRDVVEIVSGK